MMIAQRVLPLLSEQFILFLIIMSRLITTFSTLAFFRREMLPTKVMLLFCMVLTGFLMTYGVLGEPPTTLSLGDMFLSILMQLFLGLLTGFIINLYVDIFIALGQIISVQSGLGFVNLFIPKVGTITPLSQFFFIMASLIFFELNGHLLLIKMMIDSCRLHLFVIDHVTMDVLREVMVFTKILFGGSLMLSLSILIALLVSNITIATMTKFSPQLNVFSIGINLSLIVCFFMVYLCFDAILDNGKILLNDSLLFVNHVITHIN